MRDAIRTSQFKRDVKLAERRGKDMTKLRHALLLLVEEKALPERYKDHSLGGNWKGHRDLHLEPDWLLIYQIDGNDLYLARTGTHADIF
jgi:mRNA interferase YafQ